MNQELSSQDKGTQHQMFSMVEEQQSGKMTVKEFCKRNSISEARFYYWRKKYMHFTRQGDELHRGGVDNAAWYPPNTFYGTPSIR